MSLQTESPGQPFPQKNHSLGARTTSSLWVYPEEVAASQAVMLKSREQGASANTELWDWNGWEPAELGEDTDPLVQMGKTDLT